MTEEHLEDRLNENSTTDSQEVQGGVYRGIQGHIGVDTADRVDNTEDTEKASTRHTGANTDNIEYHEADKKLTNLVASTHKSLDKIIIAVAIILIMVVLVKKVLVKDNSLTDNNTNIEVTEETVDVQNDTDNEKEKDIDINAELDNIVDEVVGRKNSTTEDSEEIWQLYLMQEDLKNYAIHIDTSNNKLNAIIIAEPNDGKVGKSFEEAVTLVKSGFIGGLADNNSLVVSNTYHTKVNNYRIVVFGDNAQARGEQIKVKLEQLLERIDK